MRGGQWTAATGHRLTDAGIGRQQIQNRAQAAAPSAHLVGQGNGVQMPLTETLVDTIKNVDDVSVVTAILSHDKISLSEMRIFNRIADWSKGDAIRLSETVACVRLKGLDKLDLVAITRLINQLTEPNPVALDTWLGRARRCIYGRSDLDARPPRSFVAKTFGTYGTPLRGVQRVTPAPI